MIPVSPGGVLLVGGALLLGLLSLSGLLTLFVLLIWPVGRSRLLASPRRSLVILALLMLAGLPALAMLVQTWQQQQVLRDEQLALNPLLEAPVQLDGVVFPPGSRVHLERLEPTPHWQTGEPQPHGLQTIQQAEFPVPQRIRGLLVRALEAPSSHLFSSLTLDGAQTVDDWPCAASAPVHFLRDPEDRLRPDRWAFSDCTLQEDVVLGEVRWPADSQVRRTEYGWQLSFEDEAGVGMVHGGLQLRQLLVRLDEQREVLGWEGQLAQAQGFGSVRHPAGSEVRVRRDGNLLFSPRGEAAVDLQGGEAVPPGRSLLQAADGRRLGVFDNAEVGVIDWVELD